MARKVHPHRAHKHLVGGHLKSCAKRGNARKRATSRRKRRR